MISWWRHGKKSAHGFEGVPETGEAADAVVQGNFQSLCGEATLRSDDIGANTDAISKRCPTCQARSRDPKVTLTLGPIVLKHLEQLQRTGLFGETVEKVAEGLMLEALRKAISDGWTIKGGWSVP
jgi:hypothetical protein